MIDTLCMITKLHTYINVINKFWLVVVYKTNKCNVLKKIIKQYYYLEWYTVSNSRDVINHDVHNSKNSLAALLHFGQDSLWSMHSAWYLFLKFFDDIIDFSVCSPSYVLQSSSKTQRYFSYVEFPVVWSDTRTTKLVETMMEQEQQYHFVNTDLFFQKYNFSNIINFCWQMSFRRLNASGISPSGINVKGSLIKSSSCQYHIEMQVYPLESFSNHTAPSERNKFCLRQHRICF